MPHVDTGEPADRTLADWAVYFAALALAYIGEVVHEDRQKDQQQGIGMPVVGAAESSGQRGYGWRAQAVECMDAVAYAEQLASEARLRADVTTSAAQQLGKRGGEVRTKDYRVLRLKVLKLYTSKYQKRSNREAARLILERDLTPEDIGVFNTDDPRHRIEIWIGNHKRGALKS
jgi:hypothetical protein